MTNQKPPRPLTVDTASRSCGSRQRIHGRLQPMDGGERSRAARWTIIVVAGAAVWLPIAFAVLGGHF